MVLPVISTNLKNLIRKHLYYVLKMLYLEDAKDESLVFFQPFHCIYEYFYFYVSAFGLVSLRYMYALFAWVQSEKITSLFRTIQLYLKNLNIVRF
jgi:hypothetical protein